MVERFTTTLAGWTRLVGGGVVAMVLGLMALGSGGCASYKVAEGTPDLEQVVGAAEGVLKERYYQTRAFPASGHLIAISPIEMEGNHKVRRRIDVYVRYEITGHFMPMVHVRKYYDTAEPPLEGGNFADAGELTGHPAFLRENWSPLYFDHNEEEQIREAILKKLSIPSPAGAPHAPSA